MRWQQMGSVAIGMAVTLACLPSVGRADWLTLSSGAKGTTDLTAASEFWFGPLSGSSVVAVAQVAGGDTVQAATGGGTTFFGGLGTPVLLNLADGSAYLAGGNPPAGTTGRGPNGGPAGTSASTAPQSGVPIPSAAALLGLTFADLGTDGSRALTVSVTDAGGATLGAGTLAVPDGGWWVIGLGPGQQPVPDPGPIDSPRDGGKGDPAPVPAPPRTPATTPGVPEPATVTLAAAALIASGLTTVSPWLRRRRRAANA